MKEIKCIVKFIREELEDSEKYGKLAVEKKDDHSLADMYYNLSRQELSHADLLHDQAMRIIKDSNLPAPESMKAVWEWEHEWMIEQKLRIKDLHDLYKD